MKIGIGALLVSAAVALLGAATATSARRQPQLLPASAGVVTALAFDPANPNVVYAATEPGPGGSHDRVYKSTDGGTRWQRLVTGHGWFRAYALAVDPKHPRTVYVGGGRAVYKTTNGGRTWHAFNRGLLPPPGINRGEGWVDWLAVDPASTNVLYERDYANTIRKSVDGGRTWKVVLSGYKDHEEIWAPLLARSRPQTLYAGFRNSAAGGKRGVYKSANGGKTWQRMALPPPEPGDTPTLSAADPQRKAVYFAELSGVFASSDGGRNWHSIDHGLPSSPSDLAAGGGTVIATLGTDGIYVSTNEGGTWTRTWPASGSAPGLGAGRVWVDPAHPATVLATAYYAAKRPTGTHILRSTDGGRTWAVVG